MENIEEITIIVVRRRVRIDPENHPPPVLDTDGFTVEEHPSRVHNVIPFRRAS